MSVKEKKNNGGFSLVELIVVIAISVVLIGAATISIRSVMGVEVKQCARNIESIINKTRVTLWERTVQFLRYTRHQMVPTIIDDYKWYGI